MPIFTIAFVLLCIGILLFQFFGPQKSIVITADKYNDVYVIDDRSNRGKSKGWVDITEEGYLFTCKVRPSNYEYPYCQLSLILPDTLNANFATHFSIDAQYLGKNDELIRIFLRNKSADFNQLQISEMQIRPSKTGPRVLPLSYFKLATWWQSEYKLDIEQALPRTDAIQEINISTGGNIAIGEYQLLIKRMEFRGKYFSDIQTLLFVLGLTILYLLTVSLIWYMNMRKKLLLASNNEHKLRQVNQYLNIEASEYKKLASIDELTKTLNRQGLKPHFDDIITQCQLVSFIIIDIDHFKQVNDQFGHAIGDEVLKQFSEVLKNNIRSSDQVARWGGEEFLIIAQGVAAKDIIQFSNHLRETITKVSWPKEIALTASFGITHYRGQSISTCIDEADQALYFAKDNGRNQVCHFANLDVF